MTPADVERLIAKQGRTVILRRFVNGEPLEIPVKAVIRAAGAHATEGDVSQADREVKISMREIRQSNWPGPPAPGDQIVDGDRELTIEAPVDAGYIGEQLAILTMTVRG